MADRGSRFSVFLTGAFSTGTPMRVPVSEYKQLQDKLGAALRNVDGTCWNPEGVRWLDQPSYDEGGGGYSNLVPLVLIQREGGKLTTEVGSREAEAWADDRENTRWGWELKDFRIQLFDLGVGVVVGVYRVTPPSDIKPKQAAEQVRSWSDLTRGSGGRITLPIGATYERIARETVGSFRHAIETCTGYSPEPWFGPTLSVDGTGRGAGRDPGGCERGRLKWLHPVFVLPPNSDEWDRPLKASDFKAKQSTEAAFEHGCFVPGVKRSVVALDVEKDNEDLLGPSSPIGLITLNWAYSAAFMDFDRGLLATLDRSSQDDPASLPDLEAEARETYRNYIKVAEAKARLDSALNGLGPGQAALWDAIASVTRFDKLLETVESKLEVLQSIAESRVQGAVANSSRRSRVVLTSLTVLTLLTLAFALVTYFYGDQTDRGGHSIVRVAVLVGAVLIAGAVFYVAEREILHRRSSKSRS